MLKVKKGCLHITQMPGSLSMSVTCSWLFYCGAKTISYCTIGQGSVF